MLVPTPALLDERSLNTNVEGVTSVQIVYCTCWPRLMALPARWTTPEQRSSWARFKPMLPELPLDDTQACRPLDTG